ncbi:MAG: type II toxin-antitoxin system HicA family toxin [Acidobacteria bacterium]|nr:type II toxin-antitoxin system HicA family toxin [Acidobacteriota bacterium]
MAVIPILRPRQVLRVFERLGWQVARQRGSHIIMTRPGHVATLSIPNHPEVARGSLRTLIARAGLSVEEFLEVAEKL